jgi:hypothetical protein
MLKNLKCRHIYSQKFFVSDDEKNVRHKKNLLEFNFEALPAEIDENLYLPNNDEDRGWLLFRRCHKIIFYRC